MRIGYPNINWTIGCKGDQRFRLSSYSEERMRATIENNLDCLQRMLSWNVAHEILFFRIHADLIPFATHPICTFPWQDEFQKTFAEIGTFLREHRIRISTHPSQFILINALEERIAKNSIRELDHLTNLFQLLGSGNDAKIQIHVGGVYSDREASMQRFIDRYDQLGEETRGHLVIENDEDRFSVGDCLEIHDQTGIPVILDVFHHGHNNRGEAVHEALSQVVRSWKGSDGLPMVDYSSQASGRRQGVHAESIDLEDFREFLMISRPHDFDLMLEIRDKETSALKAVAAAKEDPRFVRS